MSDQLTPREKLDRLAKVDHSWKEKVTYREKNSQWLSLSAKIALRILRTLKEKGMSQKDLAKQMNVSPQMISSVVKGKENLSLETIAKIQQALGTDLIAIAGQSTSQSDTQPRRVELQVPKNFYTAMDDYAEYIGIESVTITATSVARSKHSQAGIYQSTLEEFILI